MKDKKRNDPPATVETEKHFAPESFFSNLDKIQSDLEAVAAATVNHPEIQDFERFYILAAIRRTLSLMVAFRQSVESENEQMSATIIRLNIDTLSRFYALFWAEETDGMTAESFAKQVFDGFEIRKMKLRNSKDRASDRWLIQQISPLGDWIESVYDNTCGAIHFSDFHMKRLLAQKQDTKDLKDGSMKISLALSGTDKQTEPRQYLSLKACFLHICWLLICASKDRCGLLERP